MIQRRTLLLSALLGALPAAPLLAQNAARKDSVVLGITLEPPGLDPTAGAANSIAEVTLYNIYETLTKIQPDGSVQPLLAKSMDMAADLKSCRFALRDDAVFHNGQPFNADAVKFSLERATTASSTNKDRAFFSQLRVEVHDPHAVTIHSDRPNPDLLFLLGMATAIMVEPQSAATNASQPVGTGPYRLTQWRKGSHAALQAWPQYRGAANVAIRNVTFRFIPDPAAEMASLLAGDVDVFPRAASRNAHQLKGHPQFSVTLGGSSAKTILAINNQRAPLDDVRVRRAIAAAIHRKDVIEAAADGMGTPIGSHYVPGSPGYVDTTGINPFDPDRARHLLKEAGVKQPLTLSLVLPPAAYARQGGELISAQLEQVGIHTRIQNVEWAQWMSGVYTNRNYDLTIISHVEPFDLDNFTKPGYYWGYHSDAFNALYNRITTTADRAQREQLLGDAQRMLAEDCVHAFLFQPQVATIARKELQGLWNNWPIYVNDVSALRWAG